jgi:small subunit ribosomal protein S18
VAGFGGRQESIDVSEVSEETAAPAAPPAAEQTQAPTGEGGGGYAPRGDRPAGDRGPAGGERPRRRGGGRFGRRRVCAFCVDKVTAIDYKDPSKLRRYISDRGKIEPRRKTGTCAGHQRMLTIALKRARHVALLPFTAEHIHVTGVFPARG